MCVGMGGGVWYGMVWFWLLGISASVLAGREAGLPQQLPRPGATLNPEHQDLIVLKIYRAKRKYLENSYSVQMIRYCAPTRTVSFEFDFFNFLSHKEQL